MLGCPRSKLWVTMLPREFTVVWGGGGVLAFGEWVTFANASVNNNQLRITFGCIYGLYL